MMFEFSAGGVVFRKHQNKVDILMVQHGGYSHHWSFPKGHIGDKIEGESKEEAAVREVKEETGIDAVLVRELTPIEFWYSRDGEKRKKKVYFYVMEFRGGDFKKKDFEMQKVVWIPIELVEKKVTHTSDKEMFLEAKKYIEEKL